MDISIRHTLEIHFAEPAAFAVEHLLLVPLSGPTQTVKDWHVDIPGYAKAARYMDAFGNLVLQVSQSGPVETVPIAISGSVQTVPGSGVVGRLADDPVPALFKRATATTRSPVSMWGKYRNAELDGPGRIEVLHDLMERVHTILSAEAEEHDDAPDAETLTLAFIGAVRALDIPARYITGYLAAEDGRSGPHAWAEAWDPGLGWVAFDPLLDLCPTDRHVRVAAGLDAETAVPVRCYPAPVEADDMPPPAVEISVADLASQHQTQS